MVTRGAADSRDQMLCRNFPETKAGDSDSEENHLHAEFEKAAVMQMLKKATGVESTCCGRPSFAPPATAIQKAINS